MQIKSTLFFVVVVFGFMLHSSAYALCVLMQDFDKDDRAFNNYMKRGIYFTDVVAPVKVDSSEKLLPSPTRLKVAGEPCFIFNSYSQLKDFIEPRDTYPDTYLHPETKKNVTLPSIEPHEQLFINQISHGARCGEVESGSILQFVDQMHDHPIAMTNNACFSSDLLARMLIYQHGEGGSSYSNFCLMTLSPFSSMQVEPIAENVDGSTASFLLGIDEKQKGKSFSEYFIENNYFTGSDGQKRPLGLCSAANWGEMGLADYLALAEQEAAFEGSKIFRPFGEGRWYTANSSVKRYFRGNGASEKNLVASAANVFNHLNELLNISYCKKNERDVTFANHEFMYYALNTVCSSVWDLEQAQTCLPAYHFTKNFSSFIDHNNEVELDRWHRTCKYNAQISMMLFTLKSLPEGEKKELMIGKLFETAAQLKDKCDKMACLEITDSGLPTCILVAANSAESLTTFMRNKSEVMQKISKEAAQYDFFTMLTNRLKEEAKIDLSQEELKQKFSSYYRGDTSGDHSLTLNCQKEFDTFFTLQNLNQVKSSLQQKCQVLQQDMTSRSPSLWNKLPTNISLENEHAKIILRSILGQYDLAEKDDFYAPMHDLLMTFHKVMEVSMKRLPRNEWPMDIVRRQACDNFKLGLKTTSSSDKENAVSDDNDDLRVPHL